MRRRAAPLAALLAVFFSRGAAAESPRVWVADSLTSVAKDAAPRLLSAASVKAARGEYADFQLVITATAAATLTDVDVEASDLSGPSVIPSSAVFLFRAHYVPVRLRSPAPREGDRRYNGFRSPNVPREWPDALVPKGLPGATVEAFPFTVPAGSNQPVFVDVLVPADAPAGVYRGTLTVTARGLKPTLVPLSLTVWDFSLPRRPSLASDFLLYDRWLWLASAAVGADQAALQESIWAALAEHRLGGQGGPGRWSGSAKEQAALARWLPGSRMTPAPLDSDAKQAAEFVAFMSSASRSGDLYASVGDEPTTPEAYAKIKRRTEFWRRLGVKAEITLTWGTPWDAFDADIWVPHHARLKSPTDLESVRKKQAAGGEVWSYYCCEAPAELPNWLLDFDLVHFRITPWLDFSSGFTGLLYWTTVNWAGGSRAVWTNAKDSNGDGIFFYPGTEAGAPHAAVPSARLKAVRDGVQDYEYLALLRSLGGELQARELAVSLAPAWDRWSSESSRLWHARETAARKIVELRSAATRNPIK